VQARLVAFHDKQVVSVLCVNVKRVLTLRVQRVGPHERASDVDAIQQRANSDTSLDFPSTTR